MGYDAATSKKSPICSHVPFLLKLSLILSSNAVVWTHTLIGLMQKPGRVKSMFQNPAAWIQMQRSFSKVFEYLKLSMTHCHTRFYVQGCGRNESPNTWFKQGCLEKVKNAILEQLNILATVVIVLVFLQVCFPEMLYFIWKQFCIVSNLCAIL